MDSIGNILDSVMAPGTAIGRRADSGRAASLWPEAVGAQIAAHTRVLSFSSGILRVAVDHSAWAQELSFQRERIKRSLNDRLQSTDVLEIMFVVNAGVFQTYPT